MQTPCHPVEAGGWPRGPLGRVTWNESAQEWKRTPHALQLAENPGVLGAGKPPQVEGNYPRSSGGPSGARGLASPQNASGSSIGRGKELKVGQRAERQRGKRSVGEVGNRGLGGLSPRALREGSPRPQPQAAPATFGCRVKPLQHQAASRPAQTMICDSYPPPVPPVVPGGPPGRTQAAPIERRPALTPHPPTLQAASAFVPVHAGQACPDVSSGDVVGTRPGWVGIRTAENPLRSDNELLDATPPSRPCRSRSYGSRYMGSPASRGLRYAVCMPSGPWAQIVSELPACRGSGLGLQIALQRTGGVGGVGGQMCRRPMLGSLDPCGPAGAGRASAAESRESFDSLRRHGAFYSTSRCEWTRHRTRAAGGLSRRPTRGAAVSVPIRTPCQGPTSKPLAGDVLPGG